ncbi:hypothetical protein Dimus_003720, partial [Dionaea muscipula]
RRVIGGGNRVGLVVSLAIADDGRRLCGGPMVWQRGLWWLGFFLAGGRWRIGDGQVWRGS